MQAFRDFQANGWLVFYAVGMCLTSTLLSVSQMLIVKFGSAAQKTTADILRPMFIWIYFMNVPVLNASTGDYEFEEHFCWIQFAGYSAIIVGVIVYNEIVILPIWGFDRHTQIAIHKNAGGY